MVHGTGFRIKTQAVMSYELFYTSVAQGLRPDAKGFCTVGVTRGTPALLVERLESLSGDPPRFPVGSPQAEQNPVSWAHWRVPSGGATYSVVSRVSFAGMDYTRRSNKFAHHVALASGERPSGGPAWLLSQPGFMASAWTGDPAEYAQGPRIPCGAVRAECCNAWEEATGDAGWAGVLADSAAIAQNTPAHVIYRLGTDTLRLIAEALTLVPEPQRWLVTFSTYFTDLPGGMSCGWRCCVAGTPAAEAARRSGGIIIDLTARLPKAPQTASTQLARTGVAGVVTAGSDEAIAIGVLEEDQPKGLHPATSGFSSRKVSRQTIGRAVQDRKPAATHPSGAADSLAEQSADQSWMPPVDATVVESERLDTPAHARSQNWTALIAGITVWTVLVTGIVFAVMKQQVTSLKDQLDDESAKSKQKLAEEFERGRGQPDPAKWIPIQDAAAKIQEARAQGKADGMASPDPAKWFLKPPLASLLPPQAAQTSPTPPIPAVSVEIVKPQNPTTKGTAVPPPEPKAPEALAKRLDQGANYYVDPQAIAEGISSQLLLQLPESAADAMLEFKPGAVLPAGGRPSPQCPTTRPSKSVQIVVPLGLGDTKELCRFWRDESSLWLEWPALDTAADKTSRTDFLRTACVTAGNIVLQFSAPDDDGFFLDAKSPSEVKPLALAKAVGRNLKFLRVQAPWVVQSSTASSVRLGTKEKSADAISFEIKMDGISLSSSWQTVLAGKMALLDAAKSKLQKAEDQVTSLNPNTTPTDRLNALKEAADAQAEVDERDHPVQELLSFRPAVVAIEANNGIILRRIDVKVGK
jgi:hypothetical protein